MNFMKQEEDEELLRTFIHSEYFLDQASSDADEPKKKRGRKKYEPSPLNPLIPLAPKPTCTIMPALDTEELKIKKKQERLIKNRAAALQSRKRKRDHLQTLEQDNKKLMDYTNGWGVGNQYISYSRCKINLKISFYI